ncbi:SbcC/MukB-like Walker B domain-containing protein [Lusitaniella coriacea]|uniref:SbcC/MukB-like Walker B domain-containing protein n=1 Tax=Lusitaniella coriacea TaxID=1983105 RepID=UPI003CF043F2
MRPIKLTLEGFTSFRRRQTLDFSDLDLFVITGATGAGKSSLLDAMTYALYGKVPRKSSINELVSQGATELKVEFQFSIQQTEYQVVRSWRYRPSTPVTRCLLSKRQGEQWERCDRAVKIEHLIRMDFDTFTRVIILPQGQFDEFLKGNATKRRELLRQLAGFEIFEKMRKEARDRAKTAGNERQWIEGQIESLQVPTEAEMREKQAQQEALESEIPQLKKAADDAQKLLDEEERLLAQIQRYAELQKELTELEQQAPKIESLQQQLQDAQAANTLQADWKLLQEARKQAKKAENALKATAKKLTQAQTELETQQQQYESIKTQQAEIKKQLAVREGNLIKAKAYEEQRQQYEQELTQTSQTLKSKEKQLAKAEKELKSAQTKEEVAREQLATASETLAQFSTGGARLEKLNQVAPFLTQWDAMNKTAQTARKKWEKALKERQKAESNCDKATSQHQQTEAIFHTARTALQEAEAVNTIATQHNHADALRASLQPGEMCSVCGGVYPEAHQLPPLSKSVEVDIALLQESTTDAEQAYHQAATALTKAQTKLEALQQQESEYQQDWENHESELTQCQAEISAVLETEKWEISALKQEHQTLTESHSQYQDALALQAKTANELEKLEQTSKFAQTSHAAALEELQGTRQDFERREGNLQDIQAKLHQLTEGQSYETLYKALEQDKQDAEHQLKTAEESYQKMNKQAMQAEEAAKQVTETVESTRTRREQLEAQWEVASQSVNFSEERFQEVQVTPAQQEEWERAIADYNNKHVELSSYIKEVTRSIGDRKTSEDILEQRRQAMSAADANAQQASSQQAELSTEIKIALDKQKQAQKFLKQHSTLAEEEQIYHTLSQKLKSDEFQDYLLENLQAELVERATVLLQELTDSRYTLKIQDGEYWVEDNWNGGETRRVRTLSGGETFATSLSMALALSEKLSMGVELGSLFLDEGFGTLDAETLESVTQILRSLGQQDRLIGVITHLRALAEQLPTQVKVHKSPEGSRLVVEAL